MPQSLHLCVHSQPGSLLMGRMSLMPLHPLHSTLIAAMLKHLLHILHNCNTDGLGLLVLGRRICLRNLGKHRLVVCLRWGRKGVLTNWA